MAQAEVPEDEPGATNYVFKPVTTDDVLSDKAAHLEVIRQVKCLYMPPSCMHAVPGMLSKSSHPRLISTICNCPHANQSVDSQSSQCTFSQCTYKQTLACTFGLDYKHRPPWPPVCDSAWYFKNWQLLLLEQVGVITGRLDWVQISICRRQVPAAPQTWQAEAGFPQCELWCVGAVGAGCWQAQAGLEHTEDGTQEPTIATSKWVESKISHGIALPSIC